MGVCLIFDDCSCKVRAVIKGRDWLIEYIHLLSSAALNMSTSTTSTQDNLPLVIGMYTQFQGAEMKVQSLVHTSSSLHHLI